MNSTTRGIPAPRSTASGEPGRTDQQSSKSDRTRVTPTSPAELPSVAGLVPGGEASSSAAPVAGALRNSRPASISTPPRSSHRPK